MRCPHFHDPSYAAKKEEAFKRVRRGVNHIEQDCESNEADDLREAIDPMNQHDDQYILHVAHEQLEELEMEMVMIGDNQLNSEQTESQCVAQTELTPVERALAEPRTGGVLTSRESTVTATDTVTATITGTPVHCVGAVSACHHEVQGEVQQASASASQQELELEKVLCSTNEPNGDAPHAAGQATAADSNEKVEQIEEASDESTSKHLMQKPGFSTDEGPAGAAAGHTDSEVTACSADEVPTAAAAAAEHTDSEVTGCSADERPTAAAAEHTDSGVTGCSADEVPTAAAAAAEYTDGEVTGCSANEEPTAALNPISTASSRLSTIAAQIMTPAALTSITMSYIAATDQIWAILLLATVMLLANYVCTTVTESTSNQGTYDNQQVAEGNRTSRSVRRAKDNRRIELSKQRILQNELQKVTDKAADSTLQEICDNERARQELARQTWRPNKQRCAPGQRGVAGCIGGCRRKIFRPQRIFKRETGDGGGIVSAMMIILSVMQQGESLIEMATVAGAAVAVISSSVGMICAMVHKMVMGANRTSWVLDKWLMGSTKSLQHLVPSTALC